MLDNERLELKKHHDEELYNEAMQDLLNVFGISNPTSGIETKAAISCILNYFGQKIPEIPKDITDLGQQIEYILRPSGMMKRRIELVGEWWKDGSGAILAGKKNGEIVALIPSKWSGYCYHDKFGKSVKINKKNAKEFSVDAFCFYRSFSQGPIKIMDLVKFMIKNISYLDVMFLIFIYLMVQFLGMIMPYITNLIYNIIVPSGSLGLLQTVSTTLLGITVGKILIKITQTSIKARLKGKLNLAVHSAIMMRLFSLPASFFKKRSSGDLSSRINQVAILCDIIADTFLSTLLTAFFSLGYIFQMLNQAPSMVPIGLVIIFVSLCFSVLITFLKQHMNNKKIKLAPKLQALVFNIFSGIQKIKIAGAEKRAFSIWAKEYSKSQKLEYNPPFILKIYSIIGLVITSLGSIALYWVASKNRVPVANYMAFNVAYGAVSSAIMSLNDIALKFANLKPIIDLINPFLESETENSNKGKIVDSLHGEIEICNVNFRYSKSGEFILKNLTLKINRGEYVAIVGKTGCGKSTIIRLLLGFETPERGAIYYDKRDIQVLDKRSLRQNIGVVMQNGAIFQGDIFSNIIVTSPWKTMDDAWEAARMAGFDKDIENMPMGMHTLISEGSGGISGGQKQRLMIARALIGKPKILFFDEATSALDNITQKIVADNIDKLKCTRIVIAHRLSTIKNCDRIVVIDNGTISEQGTFEELMSHKHIFYELAIRQIAKI